MSWTPLTSRTNALAVRVWRRNPKWSAARSSAGTSGPGAVGSQGQVVGEGCRVEGVEVGGVRIGVNGKGLGRVEGV